MTARQFNEQERRAGRLTRNHEDVIEAASDSVTFEAQVRDWQRHAGLTVDGRAGAETRASVELEQFEDVTPVLRGKRGAIRPTTHAEAVERARSMIGQPVAYVLGRGGTDPWAQSPGSECDCSGWTAWALGFDRLQSAEFGGYVSTDTMLADASKRQSLFEFVDDPAPGDLVVYGGTFKDGKRTKVGHCGVVSSVSSGDGPAWQRARVIDCSSSVYKRTGHAVSEREDARIWKAGRFLRYKRAF